MDKETANRIPTSGEISAASAFDVFDDKGNKVSFGSLHAERRTLIIFIRHFYCGMCLNYVIQLAEMPKTTLEETKTDLVIIGCGEWKVLDTYRKNTGFGGRIYADPSRALYRHFGMTENLSSKVQDEAKASYVQDATAVTLKSMGRMITQPAGWGKQGNISQNGGDFIFGPGDICSLAHRMRDSTDHMDVDELVKQVKIGSADTSSS